MQSLRPSRSLAISALAANTRSALRQAALRAAQHAALRMRAACGVLLALALTGALLASWLQPIAVVMQLQTSSETPVSRPARAAELSRATPGNSTQAAEAESDGAGDERYAYGVSAPLELPTPPPSGAASPPAAPPGTCRSDAKYDRYLHSQSWEGQKARVDSKRRTSYLCYRHRDVSADATLGRSTCHAPGQSCPVRHPTYPAPAEGCLCCQMAGHSCPPCWGCLLPLSRRRAFGGKLYEREIGGTANVFLAEEDLGGARSQLVFKLRSGEVLEDACEMYTQYMHVHGMCTACARHVHGMCTACARHVHGMCTTCARYVYGMRMCARLMHGGCTVGAGWVHGGCRVVCIEGFISVRCARERRSGAARLPWRPCQQRRGGRARG